VNRFFAPALLCLLLSIGCVPPSLAPYPSPAVAPGEVATLMARPLRSIASLTGEGSLRFEDRGARLVGELSLRLIADKGVRLDIFTPILTPLATLVSTPQKLIYLDYHRRRALEAPATDRTLDRFLQLPLEPRLLTQALAGGVVLPADGWRAVRPDGEAEEGLWMFARDDWRAGLDPETQRPALLADTHEQPVIVTWTDWQRIDGIDVATTIAAQRPAQRQAMRIKLTRLNVNRALDESILTPAIPTGWPLRRLGGSGE